MTSLGLGLLKITMIARWNCPMIVHYARLAPLTTIGDDFKHAHSKSKHIASESRKQGTALKKVTAYTNKLSEHMEKQMADVNEKMEKLKDLITTIDVRSRPKEYVRNKITKSVHTILISYAAGGYNAITCCKWPYAHAIWEEIKEPPSSKREVCGDCMPGLKASLPDFGQLK